MRNILKIDPRIRASKFKDYIDEPVIIYVNEFNEEAVDDFEQDMDDAHNTSQKVIPIVIDSFGGSCYGENAMVSSVLNAHKPIATIVKSKAMSAGAILFGFGTEGYRFMDAHANLMIHDASSFTCGKVEEVKADVVHLEYINTACYKRLSKHLGHNENYILDMITKQKHADWYLNAKEAKKHKFANHIRIPQFRTEVTVETFFE